MSILTDKTEYQALFQIAQTLHFFGSLSQLGVSAGDAIRIRYAENIVRSIITENGYNIFYSTDTIIFLTQEKP